MNDMQYRFMNGNKNGKPRFAERDFFLLHFPGNTEKRELVQQYFKLRKLKDGSKGISMKDEDSDVIP